MAAGAVKMNAEPIEYALVLFNLAAGFGCATLVARLIGRGGIRGGRFFRCYTICVGTYFIECVALAMGMGIPVFNVGLGILWGVIAGVFLRANRRPVRDALFLSLYCSLPAVSFIVVPLFVWFAGWSITSAKAGADFGIPVFLPWPMNTILGFYAVLVSGVVVLKTLITTGEVRFLLWVRKSRERKLANSR